MSKETSWKNIAVNNKNYAYKFNYLNNKLSIKRELNYVSFDFAQNLTTKNVAHLILKSVGF